jgi:hypothetical protein
MTSVSTYAGIAVMSIVAAIVWPVSAAISVQDVVQARIASSILSATVCAAVVGLRAMPRSGWFAVAVGAALIGTLLVLTQFNAAADCIADYEGRPVLVGREYLPEIAGYVTDNPGLSPSDRLFDAGGVAERVWTAESIRTCRLLVSASGLGALPFFALAASAVLSATRPRLLRAARPTPVVTPVAHAPVYDAFLSYRHTDVDREHASAIVEFLERHGLRVAIDFRDFMPNEHFVAEMERCIKQSRFVLCVITSEYLASDHTSEEAIISKTLDLAEKRKRLVPLLFERVELPVWLHGLVGIDFSPSSPVEPFDRLLALLTSERPRAG